MLWLCWLRILILVLVLLTRRCIWLLVIGIIVCTIIRAWVVELDCEVELSDVELELFWCWGLLRAGAVHAERAPFLRRTHHFGRGLLAWSSRQGCYPQTDKSSLNGRP